MSFLIWWNNGYFIDWLVGSLTSWWIELYMYIWVERYTSLYIFMDWRINWRFNRRIPWSIVGWMDCSIIWMDCWFDVLMVWCLDDNLNLILDKKVCCCLYWGGMQDRSRTPTKGKIIDYIFLVLSIPIIVKKNLFCLGDKERSVDVGGLCSCSTEEGYPGHDTVVQVSCSTVEGYPGMTQLYRLVAVQ